MLWAFWFRLWTVPRPMTWGPPGALAAAEGSI